jgi:excisionase family DNA binding protein
MANAIAATASAPIGILYDTWLQRTGDATAAATLVLAEVLAGESTRPVAEPMSVQDAARQLGVSKETVYKLCADNAMPHTRVGRRITISRQQLADYQSRPRFRHLVG